MQDFVRDLVQRSNIYRRTMHPNSNKQTLTDSDFLTFGKHGTIDVEAAPSYKYGPIQRIYVGDPKLTGDVSTWWDQRIPEGIGSIWSKSIPLGTTIVTQGMHSVPRLDWVKLEKSSSDILDSHIRTSSLPISRNYGFAQARFDTAGIPTQYLWEPAHQVFKGIPGTTLPGFNVFEKTPDWLKLGQYGIDFSKFSKGYKQGGIIK